MTLTLPSYTYPFEVLGGEVEEALLRVLFVVAVLKEDRSIQDQVHDEMRYEMIQST